MAKFCCNCSKQTLFSLEIFDSELDKLLRVIHGGCTSPHQVTIAEHTSAFFDFCTVILQFLTDPKLFQPEYNILVFFFNYKNYNKQ